MNIISDMNNGKGLVRSHLHSNAFLLLHALDLESLGVEGWIDWNLCLDERGA